MPGNAEDDMSRMVIQVRDATSGELKSQWKAQCQHETLSVVGFHQLVSWRSNNTPYLVHSCMDCDAVYAYDISRGQLITQYKQQGLKPGGICQGPGPDTLLLVDQGMGSRVLQLQWTRGSFKYHKQIHPSHAGSLLDICYGSAHDNIYLTGYYAVSCIAMSGGQNGQTLWQLGGPDVDVGGQQLSLNLSVCCDSAGRVYIGDINTSRLLVVDGETGELLHVGAGIQE